MLLVCACQHEVRRLARTITANQHRNLLVRQAAFGGLAAPLAGCSGKPALLAFKRFEEDRFVGFGDARQQRRPLRIGQVEKAVTPAERGIAMHVAGRSALAHALTFGHLLRVGQPLVLLPQACQRRSSQGVEGGMTCAAAIALQSRRLAPTRNLLVLAMRTVRRCAYSAFY